jgi:replicative DNA helicase
MAWQNTQLDFFKESTTPPLPCPITTGLNIALKSVEILDARCKSYNTKRYAKDDEIIESLFQSPDNYLTIIASHSTTANTNFSLSLINHFSLNCGSPVIYFSPAFDSEYFGIKLLSIASKLQLYKLHDGSLEKDEIEQMQQTAGKIGEAPIYAGIAPNYSLHELKNDILEIVKNQKVKIIIIDDFMLLEELADSDKRAYRKTLSTVLYDLHDFAKTNKTNIILTMPLPAAKENTSPELRDFGRYMLIPQIADTVIFLHSEHQYTNENLTDAKIIVAKNTASQPFTIPVQYNSFTGGFYFPS